MAQIFFWVICRFEGVGRAIILLFRVLSGKMEVEKWKFVDTYVVVAFQY